MSRKHFIALAAIVADAVEQKGADHGAWLAQRIAEVCVSDNPRFNRDRFYRACGLPDLAAN